MSNVLSKLFIFTAGVGIGAAVTWKFAKTKYEKIAQEEIDSVKEAYAFLVNPEDNVEEEVTTSDIPPLSTAEKEEYTDIIRNYNEGGAVSMGIGTPPYGITYAEFGHEGEYETMTLTHYADGVVVDDWGSVIEDIPNTIGSDFASHYGDDEEEPDIAYIRNDRLKTDYEITRDSEKYADLDINNDADEE